MRNLLIILICILSPLASVVATDEIQYFMDWESAKEFHLENVEPIIAQMELREEDKILDHSNKLYDQVESYLDRVVIGFKLQFPNQYQLQTTPQILILDVALENAMAISLDPTTGLRPNYIVVSRGLLQNYSDETVIGVLAHEMAHHALQETDFPSLYYKSTGEVLFKDQIISDPRLSEMLTKYELLFGLVGPFSNKELSGIPLNIYKNNMALLTQQLRDLIYDQNKSKCNDAAILLNQFIDVMEENYSQATHRLVITAEANSRSITDLSSRFEKEAEQCLGDKKMGFILLTSLAFDMDYNIARKLLSGGSKMQQDILSQLERIYLENNVFNAIKLSTVSTRVAMREIEDEVDFNSVRFYTNEDHADEVAVQVLASSDISIRGFNDFLVGADTECDYEDDIEPEYGTLDDSHHSSCWRAYRNVLFEKSLE
ncbi:MAG: M48 family metalloprotease [Bacteriovoracaceae bacterium]|nr:M48 family metalloprotease [Bacteriovoracaceae bacterium]